MELLNSLDGLRPETLRIVSALITAVATLVGIVLAALMGKLLSSAWLSARDRLDRETEWRNHAIELTKLETQKKIERFKLDQKIKLRPSILDFLANYRDLQELGTKSPKNLYEEIVKKRTTELDRTDGSSKPTSEVV